MIVWRDAFEGVNMAHSAAAAARFTDALHAKSDPRQSSALATTPASETSLPPTPPAAAPPLGPLVLGLKAQANNLWQMSRQRRLRRWQ